MLLFEHNVPIHFTDPSEALNPCHLLDSSEPLDCFKLLDPSEPLDPFSSKLLDLLEPLDPLQDPSFSQSFVPVKSLYTFRARPVILAVNDYFRY